MTHSKFLIYFLTFSIISLTLVVCPVQFEISYFNKRPSEEARIRAFTKYSLRDCLEECARRSYCEAAGYHRLAQFCELFSESEETTTQLDYVTIKRDDMKLPDNENRLECRRGQPNNPCKECEPPRPLNNGKYLGNMNQVGSKRVIVCEEGYTEKGKRRNIECKTNGLWSNAPGCRAMNNCELNNMPCGSNQACCNTTCRSYFKVFNNSVCPEMTEKIWIQLRCTHISIREDEQSYKDARKKCANIGERLFRVNSKWRIDIISRILQNCKGFSGPTYLVNKSPWMKPDGTLVPNDLDLWKGNASTVYTEDDCIGLTKLNENSADGYQLDVFKCDQKRPFICEKGFN